MQNLASLVSKEVNDTTKYDNASCKNLASLFSKIKREGHHMKRTVKDAEIFKIKIC